MRSDQTIGRVIAVGGSHLTVELLPGVRSYFRATGDGTELGVGVGTMLTLPLGGDFFAVGVIEELAAREQTDRVEDKSELVIMPPSIRTAEVQLLGTFTDTDEGEFQPSLTTLPPLDTLAEITNPKIRNAVLTDAPKRHEPSGPPNLGDQEYDATVTIGQTAGTGSLEVRASYNDLFSRPLAIIGSTGSGKSCTVTSIIKSALESLVSNTGPINQPHLFVLDVNGEYGSVFPSGQNPEKKIPHRIYVNGKEFPLPAWLMNSKEVCAWLLAAEATQTPALKDWWGTAKAEKDNTRGYDAVAVALNKIATATQCLDDGAPFARFVDALRAARTYDSGIKWGKLGALFKERVTGIAKDREENPDKADTKWTKFPYNERSVRDELHRIQDELRGKLAKNQEEDENAATADNPRYIPHAKFFGANLINPALGSVYASKVGEHLTTLQFRLHERLTDRRWQSLFSYDHSRHKVCDFGSWLEKLGIRDKGLSRVVVIDLSMLASDVLTMACAILGRILLELRERLDSENRATYPWVIVLEEAHNYAGPPRSTEDRVLMLSRETFERIAKEGRKFGLSLVVASQRPNEISPTIMSQCANFVSHRLQNPDDIRHLRGLAPAQAQRLLDQIAILDSGEAIVFGSSVHVPSRVRVRKLKEVPESTTSAPYVEWKCQRSARGLVTKLHELTAEPKPGEPPSQGTAENDGLGGNPSKPNSDACD